MKAIHRIITAAALACVLPAAANAATTDPEVILYRFSGVLDNGGGIGAGVATAFHCSNFSGVPETVRIVVRDSNAGQAANTAFGINHLQTKTFTTHAVTLYAQITLGTGVVLQGTAAIAATSTSIVCTGDDNRCGIYQPGGNSVAQHPFQSCSGKSGIAGRAVAAATRGAVVAGSLIGAGPRVART